MVARGAGAAGPVLLACPQWDPLWLARRLPSRGAGAWRGAPLLPWRVQCPGRVCAALAAGSGGSGRYLVLCLPRFPTSAQRVLRCVWRAVPSGCLLPSLAGTPFQAVCAFRGLGPVVLLVFPACPLCVCALPLPRCPPPPPPLPWLVWRAHLARSRCWALVGPFHAARVPPRVLPRSRAPRGLFFICGRDGPVPFPPYLAWGCALPVEWVCASGAFLRRGVGWWGGAACVPCPPTVRPGGPVGRGVASPRSVPLPSLGRQRSGCPWRRSGHGGRGPHTAPVRARLLSPGAVRVAPWRVGAGSLVLRGSCESRRLGRGGGPCSGLPLGRHGPAWGKGGPSPLPRGGWGPAPPWLAGRWEGQGGHGGGVAQWLPCTLSRGGGLRLPTQPPFRRRRIPPWRMRSVGVAGQPRAPGAACRWQASLAGGGGGAAGEPPPPRLQQTRSVPLPSLGGQHCGRHWRYSGHGAAAHILLRFVVACCPRAWPVRRSGVLVRVLPPVLTPAGASSWGRRGARRADPAASPPGRHGPFWGRADVPSAPRRAEGWRPRGPQAQGGVEGRG